MWPALEPGRHEEIRCAAVWGLGNGACGDPDRLLEFLADPVDRVALHAAAALPNLSPAAVRAFRRGLQSGDNRAAAISAATLGHHRQIATLLEEASASGPGRLWALRALGDFTQADVEAAAGPLLTAALRDVLMPMWIQHEDWLRTEDNEGALHTLSDQKIRLDPANPA